ncbi:CAP domain-containing protein [Phaeovulum sp. W22_SRMD_FR3]|uniref:CAP domain-containing protein n=1 Tax=Phaeovulum sp. W22_SRMD_FR3 TaxID=3240274 RepID=UPI003F992DB5
MAAFGLALTLALPGGTRAETTSAAQLTLTASSSGTCPMPTAEIQNNMLAAVNAQRAAKGRAPLALEPALIRAAQLHACDMATHGFFGHTGSAGTSPMRRVKDQGYKNCIVAENIALGQADVAQAMQSLLASPGHRTNIERPRVQRAGFGYLPRINGAGPWWVQVFARPC